ncbi:Succinate-semialdehyde dehydrogenase [NADP(+)] GabD, partial [Smittium mucronatum]
MISSTSPVSSIKLADGFSDPSLFSFSSNLVSLANDTHFEVKDPANLNVIGTLPDMGAAETRAAIDLAAETFTTFSKTTARERKAVMDKWYALIMENQADLARMVSLESGKPLKEAVSEVAYGASFIDWFAAETLRVDGETLPQIAANQRIIVLRVPVGVVGVITPWNFPLAMITRKVGA